MPATIEQKIRIAHGRVRRAQAAIGAVDTWWMQTEDYLGSSRLSLTTAAKAALLTDWQSKRAEAVAAVEALPPDNIGAWEPDPAEAG